MGMSYRIGGGELETTHRVDVESIHWYLLPHGSTKATKQEILLVQGGIKLYRSIITKLMSRDKFMDLTCCLYITNGSTYVRD